MVKKVSKIKVFRIENSLGEGFYLPDDRSTSIYNCGSYSDCKNHPNALEDSKLLPQLISEKLAKAAWFADDGFALTQKSKEYSYGFSDVDQLRSWLYSDEWLVYLHNKGFKLVLCLVDSDKILFGNTQCMFIKPAKYVKRNILKYFKLSPSKP